MKKILFILLSLASFAGYAQTSTFGGIGLRVNDSTTYQTNAAGAHSAGYYDIYFNNQATTKHWDVWNGSSYDHVFDFNSGGGAGTPGGSDTQVQFNNAGAFGGDPDFTFTGGNTLNIDFVIVDTEAYDATGWNGDNSVPTKDAVRDKIETSISIPQASVSTAGSTITLDMESLNAKSFYGSATFSGPKTMAMSNVNDGCTCLLSFNFWFEVTNVAAVLTFPSDWFSGNANFDGTAWTPPAVGIYEFGGSYNDSANRWSIKISNPEQ